jgi:hypothetical protein
MQLVASKVTNISIHVEVFWVVTPCSVVVVYPEDGGSMDLRNVGILQQHHTASQPEDLD